MGMQGRDLSQAERKQVPRSSDRTSSAAQQQGCERRSGAPPAVLLFSVGEQYGGGRRQLGARGMAARLGCQQTAYSPVARVDPWSLYWHAGTCLWPRGHAVLQSVRLLTHLHIQLAIQHKLNPFCSCLDRVGSRPAPALEPTGCPAHLACSCAVSLWQYMAL